MKENILLQYTLRLIDTTYKFHISIQYRNKIAIKLILYKIINLDYDIKIIQILSDEKVNSISREMSSGLEGEELFVNIYIHVFIVHIIILMIFILLIY